MNLPRQSILPKTLQSSIAQLGEKLKNGKSAQAELDAVVSGLGALAPQAVVRVDREVAHLAQLHSGHQPGWSLMPSLLHRASTQEMLQQMPGLEYLFLFHGDGRVREAALDKINVGLPNAFFFAAVAYRLNDWAAPVRDAARACAARVFARTDPAIVAVAGLFLLDRKRHWRRWNVEAIVLDDALAQPDATDHLATLIRTGTSGRLSTVLRYALQRQEMDRHLLDLSTHALQPAVRAVALRSLIEGRAIWPTGFERIWVDKPYGISRRVTVFGEREIIRPYSLGTLIRRGAHDKSALVRKVAADGLILYRSSLANVNDIVTLLAGDRSRAVRERAEFVIKQRG